ncbi:MAG: HlyD family efflux transporter periplasmic adaptor subunit [Bacteroidales bacterium]|nr:HlyD family efflux transporter periplasmic adaptor subunit [Bacteroidales bacterium]
MAVAFLEEKYAVMDNMDRIIEKKKWSAKRIILIAGGVVLIVFLSFIMIKSVGGSKLNVDAERLIVGMAKNGNFREYIPVIGIVQPITTIYLDLQEGGRVEEIYVEDGAVLKKGDPILRLSNTDLELSLVNQETAVYNLLTQMQIAQNNARQNTISNQNLLVDVGSQLVEAERNYIMNKKLYESGVLSQDEFQATENNYLYLQEKQKLVVATIRQDSISSAQQMSQAAQSYEGATNSLDLMRRKFADLIVRAPVEGQLTALDAEIGQSKNKGERVGQIDVLSGFKVRVDVDEHYISRIYPGLEGQYKQGDSAYVLTIKKVYTQVSGGRFAVDMMFHGVAPSNIRRGQTLQIRIALSDETEALLIPRGGFYQQTGGNWIFKVTKDGHKAYRANIRIGRQNPDYYEVLEGLEPGDKVIVNSYDNYRDIQELILK